MAPNEPNSKRLLLNEKYRKAEDLSPDAQKELAEYLKTGELYELEIGYENYDTSIKPYNNVDEALKILLPDVQILPSSYETIGTIIHFNLPKALSPLQKHLIGQVYLDVHISSP